MATIGWYGPLIDLSKAASHIGDYVQLLVFVHRSTPIQYKLSKGGEVIRTDIQVGDDTRPFFSISIWKKQMGSMVVAGDVILLQNVRVTRFGDVVEARTIQYSSFQCLVHPNELLVSKGVVDLIGNCRLGIPTKEKLQKVIEWVQRAGPTLHHVELDSYRKGQSPINWKVHVETQSQDCFSLSEVLHLTEFCKATFYATVGEIFLPITWMHLHEFEEERMFISKRLHTMGDSNLAEDLICTGCQLCGAPLSSEFGHSMKQNTITLYCPKSSSRLHTVSLIYRPFMLYVWDDSNYVPLLVTNKAAELLFGNVKAERVHNCHKRQTHRQRHDSNNVQKENHSQAGATSQPVTANRGITSSHSAGVEKSLGFDEKDDCHKNPNFYLIWLILLKMLLQQGKNSPLKFKVTINPSRGWEAGRLEMVCVSMPTLRTNVSSV